MKTAALIGAMGLALLAGCATTGDQQTSSVAAAAPAETNTRLKAPSDPDYDPDEVICSTNNLTGSRLAKVKDCRTAEEWSRSQSNATRGVNAWKDRAGKMSPDSQ